MLQQRAKAFVLHRAHTQCIHGHIFAKYANTYFAVGWVGGWVGWLVGGWTKVWRYNFDWWSAIAAESIESLPTSAVKGAACFPSALNNWRQSVTSLGQGVLTHACSVLLHNHVTPIYTSTRNVKTGLDPLRSAARLFGSLFSSWDHNS